MIVCRSGLFYKDAPLFLQVEPASGYRLSCESPPSATLPSLVLGGHRQLGESTASATAPSLVPGGHRYRTRSGDMPNAVASENGRQKKVRETSGVNPDPCKEFRPASISAAGLIPFRTKQPEEGIRRLK